jgi:hypothetical protein
MFYNYIRGGKNYWIGWTNVLKEKNNNNCELKNNLNPKNNNVGMVRVDVVKKTSGK